MQITTASDIGAFIRERRTLLGLSQEDLAIRVGVRRLWIVQLEKGKPTAQIGLILRAFRELRVVIDVSVLPITSGKNKTKSAVIDLNSIIRQTRSRTGND